MTTPNGNILVASQLSALLPPSQPISVPTTKQDVVKLHAENPPNCPREHATFAKHLYTPMTGNILLRVTHESRVLEIISLSSSDAPPLRFDFPSPLLPYPSIMLHESQGVHLIAVTATGSLYCIVIPVHAGKISWPPQSTAHWCHEYFVQGMGCDTEGLVHVQSPDCVIVRTPNGSLLRVERNPLGNSIQDSWTEQTLHAHAAAPIAFLLPKIATPNEADEIISIASLPQPTEIDYVWTLSRNRTLRLWSAANGVIAHVVLPAIAHEQAVALQERGSVPPAVRYSILLPPEPQNLLRVFSVSETDTVYVLVFIPTETSPSSGGFFQLFTTTNKGLQKLHLLEAPEDSTHCHLQDFTIVDGRTLYTLWDRQGQSMVHQLELTFDESASNQPDWRTMMYPAEVELTPTYLDELLLSPGSLSERFFESIMRPGMFSPLTLKVAIDRYTNACLSLPSLPPSQLVAVYSDVKEQIAAIVGCTVQVTRDPHSGALQWAKYWNALKRDWEGFIARCREIERSARLPLAIGMGKRKDGLVIIERERVASTATEDGALKCQRLLSAKSQLVPDVVEFVWDLRSRLGSRAMNALEGRLSDILHQEVSFSFADIIKDQAATMELRAYVDGGFDDWIAGRLEKIADEDLLSGVRTILDIVGSTGLSVKDEEISDDSTDSLSQTQSQNPNSSEWKRTFAASYLTATVHARYELCSAVMVLLFWFAHKLNEWPPTLLAEAFAVHRGTCMLRDIAWQPVSEISTPPVAEASSEDDVVTQMSNMNVSSGRSGVKPTMSLVQHLLIYYGITEELPKAAFQLLDQTGFLRNYSPAFANKQEVRLCEDLRRLGYHEVAGELLSWFPGTPAVKYVEARLWLDENQFDNAATILESLAGSFGPELLMSSQALSDADAEPDDQGALGAVLPGAQNFRTEFDLYLHAVELFGDAKATAHEVSFAKLAISHAPTGGDMSALWQSLIKGLTDLGRHENAYMALVSTPYDKVKRERVSQLVFKMCEEDAIERLLSFNFATLGDEVEDALSFKARNADPRVRPFYSRILYTWYVSRGDYRNASLVMYQRARKLAVLIEQHHAFRDLAEQQLEAYIIAMEALALVDRKNAWIIIPITEETEHEPRKRRRLCKHIPKDKFSSGKRDVEIVELADMQYECALLTARLELIGLDHTLSNGVWVSTPSAIVMKFAQMNRLDKAFTIARALGVDMSRLFAHLTTQCLHFSRKRDAMMTEDVGDWLLTDKVSSWSGTMADRAWRYLRQALERYDGSDTDHRYYKEALETVLSYDASPPPWLTHLLGDEESEYLLRTYMRYNRLESALEYTILLFEKSDARLAQDEPRKASATWLPYTLIDQVLLVAQEDTLPRVQELQKRLRAHIANHIKRVEKLRQASQ